LISRSIILALHGSRRGAVRKGPKRSMQGHPEFSASIDLNPLPVEGNIVAFLSAVGIQNMLQ
jgi:hypothetical protein